MSARVPAPDGRKVRDGRSLLVLSVLLLLLSSPSFAESFHGQVIMVKDGDNIFVKSGDNTYHVKLYGIDCPDLEQEFGEQAKQYAEDLLKGRDVWVDVKRLDHSKRRVSKVMVDGKDASVEIARAGLAWYDSRANSEPGVIGAQIEAQSHKIGIWSRANPVSPWDYRYQKSGITPVMSKEIGNIPAGHFDGGMITASWPRGSGRYFYSGGSRYYSRPRSSYITTPSGSSSPFTNNCINRNPFTNNVINSRSY